MLIRSLILALLALAGLAAPAEAVPLIASAIAGALSLGALGTAIVTGLVTLALGVGLQVLSSLLLRKNPNSGEVGGTTGKLQTGGTVARSFPIGRSVVSHSLVYANTFGQEGKTPNAYLVQVFALSDLPVAGLAEVWVNGSKVTWNPGATPSTEGIAIPEFAKGGTDYLWLRFYDGTQTGADSRLVSLFSTDSYRPYDAGRVGTGVSYVVAVSRYERELFGGFPQFKFVVDGVSLYDPRQDTTAGGSGSQRWSTPSTWGAAVSNPMVVAYNVLRGVSYGGEWFFGGQTVSAAQLPFAAWNAAMNECDVATDSVGGIEAQFAANGEIRLDMSPAEVVEKLLTASNGRLGEVGGIYKPHVGAAGVAVLSITDDDILSTEPQTFEPFKNLAEQVNGVTGKYIEPREGWTAKDAPPLYNLLLEAEDGGRRQVADVAYDFVTSGSAVQRLMNAALLEHRRERSHILPLPPEAYVLEPTVDFISWSSERNGYVNKLFRVEAVQDQENLVLIVSLTEVDPADYDWDAETDERPIVISPTPLVLIPSQPIPGFNAEGVTITTAAGVSKAGIRITWTGADMDDVTGVEFQIWNNAQTSVVFQGQTAPSTVPLGYAIVDGGVVSATAYKVRARFVSGSGRATTWSDFVSVTTPDVRVNWGALETATQRGLEAVAAKVKEADDLLAQLAAQVQAIEQGNLDQRQTIVRQVVSVQGQASAQLLQTYQVLATADAAFASTLSSLSATFNDPVTGVAATRATLLDFQSTQATFNTATTTSITGLSATVNDPSTGLAATRATLTSFQSAQATTNSAVATSLSSLSASYNGISASGQISMVALAGTGGYSAFYEVRIAAGSGSAAFRMTVDGTSGLSGIDFYASRTRFLTTSGVAFATFDATTGKLAADALDVASATSGERTEIKKTGIRVYDSGGTLRAAIGLLP